MIPTKRCCITRAGRGIKLKKAWRNMRAPRLGLPAEIFSYFLLNKCWTIIKNAPLYSRL